MGTRFAPSSAAVPASCCGNGAVRQRCGAPAPQRPFPCYRQYRSSGLRTHRQGQNKPCAAFLWCLHEPLLCPHGTLIPGGSSSSGGGGGPPGSLSFTAVRGWRATPTCGALQCGPHPGHQGLAAAKSGCCPSGQQLASAACKMLTLCRAAAHPVSALLADALVTNSPNCCCADLLIDAQGCQPPLLLSQTSLPTLRGDSLRVLLHSSPTDCWTWAYSPSLHPKLRLRLGVSLGVSLGVRLRLVRAWKCELPKTVGFCCLVEVLEHPRLHLLGLPRSQPALARRRRRRRRHAAANTGSPHQCLRPCTP